MSKAFVNGLRQVWMGTNAATPTYTQIPTDSITQGDSNIIKDYRSSVDVDTVTGLSYPARVKTGADASLSITTKQIKSGSATPALNAALSAIAATEFASDEDSHFPFVFVYQNGDKKTCQCLVGNPKRLEGATEDVAQMTFSVMCSGVVSTFTGSLT